MEFEAKSAEQIAREGLLEKGEYAFEVLVAEDTVSKSSGASMITLQLLIFTDDGNHRKLTDYLVAKMAAKLRHFCDATGLLPQYQRGTLCAADCEGRTGKCRIVIQEDKSGQYPPKNSVQDYVVRAAKDLTPERTAPVTPSTSEGDDGLPF
jgi:hypothetical protein